MASPGELQPLALPAFPRSEAPAPLSSGLSAWTEADGSWTTVSGGQTQAPEALAIVMFAISERPLCEQGCSYSSQQSTQTGPSSPCPQRGELRLRAEKETHPKSLGWSWWVWVCTEGVWVVRSPETQVFILSVSLTLQGRKLCTQWRAPKAAEQPS